MAKKKILLMSDDLRMHSGVATVSKDIVFETLHEYDWVQIGGAIKHPEKGKIIDMSKGLEKDFGIHISSIINLDTLIEYSQKNQDFNSYVLELEQYRKSWGA